MAQAPKSIPCADFLEFQVSHSRIEEIFELSLRIFHLQEYLKSLREVDDKIIYALNTTIPTNSFKGQLDPARKCRDLHVGLQDAYDQRRSAIRSCIMQTAEQVKTLKEKRDHDDKLQANSSFKAEQKKVKVRRWTSEGGT